MSEICCYFLSFPVLFCNLCRSSTLPSVSGQRGRSSSPGNVPHVDVVLPSLDGCVRDTESKKGHKEFQTVWVRRVKLTEMLLKINFINS